MAFVNARDGAPMKYIARVRTDFSTKFGIPRQSGLAEHLRGRVVFEPEFRDENALRGLEGFTHLWLIWEFSEAVRSGWSPTVRPPRLGGNAAMGVFATRSPFRPNPIGLSCVKLERIERGTPEGAVLHISGADLMDGTPLYDIKPYLPAFDAHPEARGGFTEEGDPFLLAVDFPDGLLERIPEEARAGLIEALRQDPRPAYKREDPRVFGFSYAGRDVRFQVLERTLHVIDIV